MEETTTYVLPTLTVEVGTLEEVGTNPNAYQCVRCSAYAGPSALLCPACYAKTRTGRMLAGAPHAATSPAGLCPSCGGRLVSGKCGWC